MSKLYGKMRDTRGITLNGLISEKAEANPQKEALRFRDATVSYGELQTEVNNFAAILQSEGVGAENLVGIYMDRSEKMIISILAVLKAGGAYVPLDPAHPEERNTYIIEKSHISIVITEKKYAGVLENFCKTICTEDVWEKIRTEKLECKDLLKGGTQLAYVIFTSGSTGKPKGVQVEHEGMVNYLLSVSDNLSLDSDVRGLSVVTITFDISISEIFLPLINGGTLVIADNETAKDGMGIVKLIGTEKINLCGFTPSTAYMLLDAEIRDLSGMKMLIGGEPWDISLAHTLKRLGCAQLWNVYGPTETTIYSAMTELTEADTLISIGQPVDQTDLYVLDESMTPVEDGMEGELYIGGIGVARGYFENPELTAERFLKNPIDPERGRIYKTGDIVRYSVKDGIVYVGRSDFQVKVHGFRIELGEIEAAISKNELVEQAVVVVNGEGPSAKLHAFVKTYVDKIISSDDLRKYVEEQVPYYMVPNIISFVKEYPMTANLKVDRKALMAVEEEESETQKEYVAPRNEIEEEIAGIWQNLLEVDQISVFDDFLEAGGHSLLANRLLIRINKTFGTTIKLVEMFSREMTIAEMALMVEENLLEGLSEEEMAQLLAEEGDNNG